MSRDLDDPPRTPLGASDRRTEERHAAAVATLVEVGGVEHAALLRDLSVTGAMCLATIRLEPGASLRLHLWVDGDRASALVLHGNVVRTTHWQGGSACWPYSLAIRLDGSAEAHIERIRAIGERQVAQGLLPSKA